MDHVAVATYLIRFFRTHADEDGMISAAYDLAAAAAALTSPEPLLRLETIEPLMGMLESTRADARLAGCTAVRAACRFDAVQQECVAQGAAALVTGLLADGMAAVQLEACRTVEVIARHSEGREAFTRVGSVPVLLRLARDELHPAQEQAAAALAFAVGLDTDGDTAHGHGDGDGDGNGHGRALGAVRVRATPRTAAAVVKAPPASKAAAAPSSTMPALVGRSSTAASSTASAEPDPLKSFVIMAESGGAISREQAAHGLRRLCRTSLGRRRLVRSGAVEALLSCTAHWKVEVIRAAATALEALTKEPAAALKAAHSSFTIAHLTSTATKSEADTAGEADAATFAAVRSYPAAIAASDTAVDSAPAVSESVTGLVLLTQLMHHHNGATRLAAQHTYINICSEPGNSVALLGGRALSELIAPLRDDAPAESQQAAAQALGALCTHARLTQSVVAKHQLLPLLLAASHGKQRHMGRRAALKLKTSALVAIAALAKHPDLHDYLIVGGLAHELVTIAQSTPHADAQRALLLALLRLLCTPHSSSRLQLARTVHAVPTLRNIFRAKNANETSRLSAAIALGFIAADPQCHLPCGQPPREQWLALSQGDVTKVAVAVGVTPATTAADPTASNFVANAAPFAASATVPGHSQPPPTGSATGAGVANVVAAAATATAPSSGSGLDLLAEVLPPWDGDFLAGLVGALRRHELAYLALSALSRLALKWELHGCLFDAGATWLVVRIARSGLAAALIATEQDPTAGGVDAREEEARRAASGVLVHINAARELRLSARHALPLPRGALVAVDAADIASLASALSAASADTVSVAVCGLATLTAAHSTNRDKLAARHCVSQLLALAQSEIVPVQHDALRTLSAMALHAATKEELMGEGVLQLLLNLFEATLHAPPTSPRLRLLQHARLLATRRLAACTLANLAEGHLRVQAAIVQHRDSLRVLITPLQRHHAAISAATSRSATGAPRTAHEEAAHAVADAAEAGVCLDARSRAHLLRCLANLCHSDANHSAMLESALLPELPSTVRRGSRSERRSCALALAHLAPDPASHSLLTNAQLLTTMISLLEAPAANMMADDEDLVHGADESEAVGGAAEEGVAAGAAAASTPADGAAEAVARPEGSAPFTSEAALALWEPGGEVVEGRQDHRSTRLLVLLTLAELSANEGTHPALVHVGIVDALLPLAAPATDGSSATVASIASSSSRTSNSYGPASEDERMEAIVALANLAENPEVHDTAFSGASGTKAFELFVMLIKAATPNEQREGFRALSCLALARSRAAATMGGGVIDPDLMILLLRKAEAALHPQPDGRANDEEVAFHAARALSLLSSNQANRHLIVAHGGLPIMYALARQADADIQAEATTVIANVTSASWDAQLRVCTDGVVQLLLYLCSSSHEEVRAAAARAVANLTQNIDNEPVLRAARSHAALFASVQSGSADVSWQCKRALANLEAARVLVGLRKYGGSSVVITRPGEIASICTHADAANVGAQREVGRALANLAAAAENHLRLIEEGGFTLCMDLVVSNSAEVQQQATRALGNLALATSETVPERMVDEGVLELLVLLAASWDDGVQQEASIALATFAARPRYRAAVVRAGVLAPLLEQLKSANAAVRYHGALCLMAVQ